MLTSVLVLGLAAGCTTSDDVAAEAPSPTPTPLEAPSPTPSPPAPPPVRGEVVATSTTDTSSNERLGLEEDGPPAPGSIEAATTAVTAALDEWLGSAQSGTPALAALRGVWIEQSDPATAEVLRSGITNRDNPVASATYRFDVHLEPDPTLVVADVAVDRQDGTSVRVEMVFDVTGDRPLLHLLGPPAVG